MINSGERPGETRKQVSRNRFVKTCFHKCFPSCKPGGKHEKTCFREHRGCVRSKHAHFRIQIGPDLGDWGRDWQATVLFSPLDLSNWLFSSPSLFNANSDVNLTLYRSPKNRKLKCFHSWFFSLDLGCVQLAFKN